MTGHGICLLDRPRMSGIAANVRMEPMSAAAIDAYLQALDEPKRRTLTQLRETILDILPDADQSIADGAPAFKVGGKRIAGFAGPLRANCLSPGLSGGLPWRVRPAHPGASASSDLPPRRSG